jgi:hypothetical protein
MGHVQYLAAVAGQPTTRVFEVAALENGDPRRRVAFPFARKLTRAPATVAREDVDALRSAFTEAEVVQLTFAICHFNTMNRLAEAFGVPLEGTNVFARRDAPPAPAPAPSASSQAAVEASTSPPSTPPATSLPGARPTR